MGSLAEVFSRREVMALAGPAVHARGASYFRQGRAETLVDEKGRLRATVRGSLPYTVELWDAGGEPGWSCTCPYAEEGAWCKHAVAATMLLDGADLDPLMDGQPAAGRTPHGDQSGLLAEHVEGLDRQRLVEPVLEATDDNWRLRERLLAEAHSTRGEAASKRTPLPKALCWSMTTVRSSTKPWSAQPEKPFGSRGRRGDPVALRDDRPVT